jgi:hypothetical protein
MHGALLPLPHTYIGMVQAYWRIQFKIYLRAFLGFWQVPGERIYCNTYVSITLNMSSLTTWKRTILEILTATYVVKIFTPFTELKFLLSCSKDSTTDLSWYRWFLLVNSHYNAFTINFNIIFISNNLPGGLSPSVFKVRLCLYVSFESFIFLDLIMLIIFAEEYTLWSSSLCKIPQSPVEYDRVRLCLRTAATNGPIVHSRVIYEHENRGNDDAGWRKLLNR